MKKTYHIAVEGSIGVGKTSLSKLLSEKLQSKLVLEEFEFFNFGFNNIFHLE